MRREFSAGAVLVRKLRGEWVVASIRPAGSPPGTWVLPKGRLEEGESSEQAALRELVEETGAHGSTLERLGKTEYWYSHGGERILKVVTFFLVRYRGGRLGGIPPEARVEVAESRWLPLLEAPEVLAYRGERELAARALELLRGDHDV